MADSFTIEKIQKEPLPGFRDILRYSWTKLRMRPGLIAASTTLTMIVTATDLLQVGLMLPLLHSFIGSNVAEASDSEIIAWLSGLFDGYGTAEVIYIFAFSVLGLTLVRIAASLASTILDFRVQISVENAARHRLMGQALATDLGHLERSRFADLQLIMNAYPNALASFIFTLLAFIPTVLKFGVTFGIVAFISWELTIVSAFVFGLSYWLTRWVNKNLKALTVLRNVQIADLNHRVIETLNAMPVVRAFSQEQKIKSDHAETIETYTGLSLRTTTFKALLQPIQTLTTNGSLILILVLGTVFFSYDGEIWIELIVFYLLVTARLSGPVSTLIRLKSDLVRMIPSAQVAVYFLQETEEPKLVNGTQAFDGLKRGITIDHVSYAYSTEGRSALNDVSLEITKGATTALVGVSGSGKSTLAKLLMRFDDPSQGRILVDGQPLSDLDLLDWRGRIGVVSQSTILFNTSIRENIRFGKPDASDEQVEEAARRAHAFEFIEEMDDGFETMVGDRGLRLSGGQAQRIAIARAIIRDPDILIFDEATSALDTLSEVKVQQALNELRADRTVVIIAHRLSTIRDADRIVVIEEGTVAETGSYEQLVARKDRFWQYLHATGSLGEGAEATTSSLPDTASTAPNTP
ncbi:MAG: ABC transporter ATP-binding protein [Magnetovibrionaceae bacterium]